MVIAKHSASTPLLSVAVRSENGSQPETETSSPPSPTPPTLSGHYRPLDQRIARKIEDKEPFYSLEFFPPRTLNGVANLISRLETMGEGGPLFVDITWHVASDPGSEKVTSSSSIAGAALNYCRLETMLHITCVRYTKAQNLEHLERAKKLGIRNILALGGDVDDDLDINVAELRYAEQFVRVIRETYKDYFVICVAGYPSGHPDAVSYEADLLHLKAKVDAGADFIITQLFFDVDAYCKFVQDCRTIGITIPIIPGIMPIQSYDSLRHICKLSKLQVPQDILENVETNKQNDEAIRNYGIDFGATMCRKLLESGLAPGLHFYTLNREVATIEILKRIGLYQENKIRLLPWKPHTSHHKRCKEDVRPIFWCSRPKSYIYRTQNWDEFPNGRWGSSSSPAFGDLKDYYLFYLVGRVVKEDQLKMWCPDLVDERDVWKIFHAFVSGENNQKGFKVKRLPWNEEDLQDESNIVRAELSWCNEKGVLTINSQPNVNGAPSTDPILGWGKPGGYVYQKAYLEFFTCQENVEALETILPKYPHVNYHIMNYNGDIDFNNDLDNAPNAVTWGVFPGCEIKQPTVVDPISFHVWKDEAFETWTHWAKLFPDDSPSSRTLHQIHDNYCLVTLVDNDYPKECCLWQLLKEMLAVREARGSLLDENNGSLRIIANDSSLIKCTIPTATAAAAIQQTSPA